MMTTTTIDVRAILAEAQAAADRALAEHTGEIGVRCGDHTTPMCWGSYYFKIKCKGEAFQAFRRAGVIGKNGDGRLALLWAPRGGVCGAGRCRAAQAAAGVFREHGLTCFVHQW